MKNCNICEEENAINMCSDCGNFICDDCMGVTLCNDCIEVNAIYS